MNWPRRCVRVRVPATSANLGPGFDALGLALALHDEVEAEVTGSGLAVEVSGEGAEDAAAGERHLVVRAMRVAFAATAGGQPPGLALRCTNAIPQGRGLGSSAGAVVAGLLAARALAGAASPEPYESGTAPSDTPRPEPSESGAAPSDTPSPEWSGPGAAPSGRGPGPLPDDALLALATEFEGHADNAAACLAGGLTVVWNPGTGPRAVRLDPLPAIVPVLCVPVESMQTTAARRALPSTVPHADAAANAGRAALLVTALTQAPDLLLDATQDVLHQPYRAPLMPATADLIGRLRGAGIAAVLSGAGPSVLALTVRGKTLGPAKVDSIASQAGRQWHVSPLDVDRQGATIASVPPGDRPPIGANARTART
jgi:homoserine kinase